MSKLKFQNISAEESLRLVINNKICNFFNPIIKKLSGEIEINKKTLIVVKGDTIRPRALVRLLGNICTSYNIFRGRITIDDMELTNENFYGKQSCGFLIKHRYYNEKTKVYNTMYTTPLINESFGLRKNLTIKQYVSFLLKMKVLKDEEKVYKILKEYDENFEFYNKISYLNYLEQYMLNNLLGFLQDKDFFFTEANDNEQKKILFNLIEKTGYNKTLVCVQNRFEKTDENFFDNLIYIDAYEKVSTADFSDKLGLSKIMNKVVELKEYNEKNNKVSNFNKKIETEFPNKEFKISDILTLFKYERLGFFNILYTLTYSFLIMGSFIYILKKVLGTKLKPEDLNVQFHVLSIMLVFILFIFNLDYKFYSPKDYITYLKELSEGYYSFYSYRVAKTLNTIFCYSIIYLIFTVAIMINFSQYFCSIYIQFIILDLISFLIFSYYTLFLLYSIYDKNYFYIILGIYYSINLGFFPLLRKFSLFFKNKLIYQIQENIYYNFLEVFFNPLVGIENLKIIKIYENMTIMNINSTEYEDTFGFLILNLFENNINLLMITIILGLISNFYIFHRIFKSRRFN